MANTLQPCRRADFEPKLRVRLLGLAPPAEVGHEAIGE